MPALVLIEPRKGRMTRFTSFERHAVVTHRYDAGGFSLFDADVVEEFRATPPDHMRAAALSSTKEETPCPTV